MENANILIFFYSASLVMVLFIVSCSVGRTYAQTKTGAAIIGTEERIKTNTVYSYKQQKVKKKEI